MCCSRRIKPHLDFRFDVQLPPSYVSQKNVQLLLFFLGEAWKFFK